MVRPDTTEAALASTSSDSAHHGPLGRDRSGPGASRAGTRGASGSWRSVSPCWRWSGAVPATDRRGRARALFRLTRGASSATVELRQILWRTRDAPPDFRLSRSPQRRFPCVDALSSWGCWLCSVAPRLRSVRPTCCPGPRTAHRPTTIPTSRASAPTACGSCSPRRPPTSSPTTPTARKTSSCGTGVRTRPSSSG